MKADVLLVGLLPRAIETAQIIAPALGLEIARHECDLREVHSIGRVAFSIKNDDRDGDGVGRESWWTAALLCVGDDFIQTDVPVVPPP